MKTGTAILGMVVVGAAAFVIGRSGEESGATIKVGEAEKAAPAAGKKPAAPAAAQGPAILKVPVGNAPAKGPADALVTIVEFSDFECPFCSRVNPTLKQVQDTYGDKVRIVFKQNPLPFHKNAPLAHEYALAANEQGKFWDLHDKFFANLKALQADKLDGYAQAVGLDMVKLKASLATGKPKAQVKADQALAAKVGARGTPNFFINGEQLTGAQPFAKFKAVIDKQLKVAEALIGKGVKKKDVYANIMKTAREKAPPPKPRKQQPRPPAVRQKVALQAGTPSKGGKNPLVTIVAWSDFECPFCNRANPTIKQILETYGDKVQIQFRNQPLSFHKNAKPAAYAGLAAHKQGKFWEMHDKMFANMKSLTQANFDKWAGEIGLNLGKFKKDMASKAIIDQVAKDMADGSKFGARGTPTFFVNGVPVRGAQPFNNFKPIIDKEIELANKYLKKGTKRANLYQTIIDKEGGKPAPGQPQAKRPSAPPAPKGPVDIKIGNAPVYGSKSAPVKIVIWSDFECPFCSRVNPAIEQVKKEYGKKVAVSFKHFPLPFHKNAELAAVAAIAAQNQGKFWEMHDKLFANQKALQRDNLIQYAKDLGLNIGKFTKDLDNPANKARVKAEMAEGSKVGVRGTPASFVNGRMISGAQPFQNFKALIDQELKNKG
ncbi:MAG: thioredoxin domain-containing protein [Myxococcota bacterium]|nr:thioredoxin domain-containing protein [Myxococcota bacterium]